MQKITPNLWFDDEAEEAVERYTAVFENTSIGASNRYDEASAAVSGQPEGSVLTVEFELEGLGFVALNGGPQFEFTPAISFIVNCPTAADVDELWAALSEGGEALMPLDAYPFSDRYGWTTDAYGVAAAPRGGPLRTVDRSVVALRRRAVWAGGGRDRTLHLGVRWSRRR